MIEDEVPVDPITGRPIQKKSLLAKLNQRKLSKYEMDEIFLGDN